MDIATLILRNIRDYTKTSSLNKLVFENNNIHIHINAWSEKLSRIKLTEGIYEGNLQISESEYDKIICPVYFFQADVGFKAQSGFVNGVIRPRMSTDLAKILPDSGHEAHFYYECQDEKLLGRSTHYRIGRLSTQLINWEDKDYELFFQKFMKNPNSTVPPWFEVNISSEKDPDNRKYGQFKVE